MYSQIMRSMLIITTCTVLVSFCSFKLHAAQGERAIPAPLLQKVLNGTGLEVEIVTLNRDDDYAKGIYIENIKGYTVLIGFPKRGILKETPFLLSIDGEEALVTLSEEGMLKTMDTDAALIPAGIDDMIECILATVDEFLEDLEACGANPFCYAFTSIIFSVEITACVADLF